MLVIRLATFLSLSALLLAHQAQAGINQGHSKRKYAAADWYLNHKPAPVTNSIPEAFNWCNHDGTNYCTASWNQHIPV